VKLALSGLLKRRRVARRLSQEGLADRIGSSQSRIAKLEAGQRGVTLDLLFRALLATGTTKGEIGRELQHKKRRIA
jgi:transcriptional regulator with XRE-family HTH domain